MTLLAASAMVLLAAGSAEIAPIVVQAPDSPDKNRPCKGPERGCEQAGRPDGGDDTCSRDLHGSPERAKWIAGPSTSGMRARHGSGHGTRPVGQSHSTIPCALPTPRRPRSTNAGTRSLHARATNSSPPAVGKGDSEIQRRIQSRSLIRRWSGRRVGGSRISVPTFTRTAKAPCLLRFTRPALFQRLRIREHSRTIGVVPRRKADCRSCGFTL